MSHVTNVILCTGGDEEDTVGSFLGGRLVNVTTMAGGNKAMECSVYLGAFTALDIGKSLEQFRQIQWNEPECAQVFIADENEERFTVHSYVDRYNDIRSHRHLETKTEIETLLYTAERDMLDCEDWQELRDDIFAVLDQSGYSWD